MSSLWSAVILGLVVLIYKFATPLRMHYELALSAALVALGVALRHWGAVDRRVAIGRRHRSIGEAAA